MSLWWQIPPQHQSTYLRGPEPASIDIPSFRLHFIKFSKTVFYEVNLTSQQSHLEIYLLSKCWSESGDFNYADSGRLSFVLWCCGSICHQVFTLFRLAVAILWLHDLCFFFLPFLTCKVKMISRKIKFLKSVTLAGDQLARSCV